MQGWSERDVWLLKGLGVDFVEMRRFDSVGDGGRTALRAIRRLVSDDKKCFYLILRRYGVNARQARRIAAKTPNERRRFEIRLVANSDFENAYKTLSCNGSTNARGQGG